MTTYIVYIPFRGEEVHVVEATSKAEAKRLVDSGEAGDSMLDWNTITRYNASHVRLDNETFPPRSQVGRLKK